MVISVEKYCTNCRRVFDDLNFKLCPYCGSELATRYGRQPIPRKLRHEVFKRDGYRCRECGASKDETSLEIDHILPVAKGGTNDIDNLQTLCRECNGMKHTDEWVGGETDYETVKQRLDLLKNQIIDIKVKLEHSTNEDDKIEYEYQLMKLEEKLPIVELEFNNQQQLYNEKQKLSETKKKKKKSIEKSFKKLYVKLDDCDLESLSKYYNIDYTDKSDLIRCLLKNHSEEEILYRRSSN